MLRNGPTWGAADERSHLLAIFGFLLVWILNVALSARDRVGAVSCIGVAAMTFWHVVVNVAMVLGLAPGVGMTLPFVSYGGNSLVTFFLALELVTNVSQRKHGLLAAPDATTPHVALHAFRQHSLQIGWQCDVCAHTGDARVVASSAARW